MSEKSAVQTKKAECLSMTGYAQAKSSVLGWDARVSVKSVNHRFLDLKLRLPDGFDLYELRLRQLVRERIHRGHVEVHVSVEPGAATPIQVNRDLVTNYLRSVLSLDQSSTGRAQSHPDRLLSQSVGHHSGKLFGLVRDQNILSMLDRESFTTD